MGITQECTNFAKIDTALDPVYSNYTITETTSEEMDEFLITLLDDAEVKSEPIDTDRYENNPLKIETFKEEELIIESDRNIETSDVPIYTDRYEDDPLDIETHPLREECDRDEVPSEMTETEARNTIEPSIKRPKRVQPRWQEDTVFQQESDALDVIRNERIWTNVNSRTKSCSKAIYTCRNAQAEGSQCDAGIFLRYSRTDTSVTMFRSVNHTCDSLKLERMPAFTYDSSVNTSMESNGAVSEMSNGFDGKSIANTETEDEKKKRRQRERQQLSKSKRTPEQAEQRRQLDLERSRKRLSQETPEQAKRRRQLDSERHTGARLLKTPAKARSQHSFDIIESKISDTSTDTSCEVDTIKCRNAQSEGSQCDAGILLQHSRTDKSIKLLSSMFRAETEDEKKKRRQRERQQLSRSNRTPEQAERRRQLDVERSRKKLSQETPEQAERRRQLNVERSRKKLSQETPEQAKRRRQLDLERSRKRLSQETPEQAERRRQLDLERSRKRLSQETPEQAERRRQLDLERSRKRLSQETPEQAERRRQLNLERSRKRLSQETPEQAKRRRQLDLERHTGARLLETPEQTAQRRQMDAKRKVKARSQHSFDIIESKNSDTYTDTSCEIYTIKNIVENINDPPVDQNECVTWDRNINCKEDLDLAGVYDLDLKIVLTKYETAATLTPCDQLTICKSIVKCYLYEDHDRNLDINDFKRISKIIVERFPSETKETYYTEATQTSASGMLYEQFQQYRGLLISAGLAAN